MVALGREQAKGREQVPEPCTIYVMIKVHASIKAHPLFAPDLQNFFS